ncbi:ABC transporter substrate binding protein [Fundicoccus sp. Sow4_H7]|uniref:ABC transporter substrate binding protein n=1 Tax=Fundicoccus sp. Sow4_H7 TaxID=3438784 RepID=UPI003F8F4EA1
MKDIERYLKKIKVALHVLPLLAASVLTAAPVVNAQEKEAISVGILQYVEHDSLDANREGFIAGLEEEGYVEGENLTINYLNGAGDNSNLQSMSENLLSSNDFVFGIATPAAQSLVNGASDTPIYFSSVTDPIEAGLVDSLDEKEQNVTGTIDAAPIAEQIELLLKTKDDIQRVGILYNSGEANSVSEANRAEEVMMEKGIEVSHHTVTSTNDINQVMSALVDEVDAIFLVTDNTIASAMALVGDLAKEAQLALVGGSKEMILENGLATYGLDYFELGKQTAKMLVRQIDEGLDASAIPVESAENLELVVNEEVAEILGIEPSSLQLDTE